MNLLPLLYALISGGEFWSSTKHTASVTRLFLWLMKRHSTCDSWSAVMGGMLSCNSRHVPAASYRAGVQRWRTGALGVAAALYRYALIVMLAMASIGACSSCTRRWHYHFALVRFHGKAFPAASNGVLACAISAAWVMVRQPEICSR